MAKLARLPPIDRSERSEPDVRVPRLRTRFYAFLSYSHKDKELADWLHRELERFRVPHSLAGKLTSNGVVPRRLTPIFRDQHDLSAGGDLADEIKAALAASQFLVVLCSPTAAKSRWTNQEIESFKRTRPEGCVLAAVASGEPFASEIPGREEEECFPPALRYKFDRRGHQTAKRADPLAADFRDVGEGKRLAFLKLVAGMLGVGLDELVQREQTRHQRKLAYVAAAAIAGMAVTSTLAVTAFQARNEARDQRREAEGLVAFMLGDLRAKLEPIGRLDALDGVGSRVLAYYSKQNTSELPDEALVQRSQALNMMGEVAFNRGDLKQAQELYQQAMAGTAEALRRAPDNASRIFDHAQNVFYVGEVARFAGHPAIAEANWREYKLLADRMVALQPDSLKYRMEAFYATEDVGISLYYQHRYAEAAQLLESSGGPMEKLVSLYPNDATYQKEFAVLLAWISDAARSQGHFGAAINARSRQISVLEHLLTTVRDSDARSKLITAHEGLALLFTETGRTEDALTQLRFALDEANQLIPVEPHNALWKSDAADVRVVLAQTLLANGQKEQSAEHTAAGCALAQELPSAYAGARTQLATLCAMMRGRLALADGNAQQAKSYAQQALNSANSQHSQDPIADRYRIAAAYRLIGDANERSGDLSSANTAWAAGLAALPQNVVENPAETDQRMQLLRRMNRTAEAAALAARLSALGDRGEL